MKTERHNAVNKLINEYKNGNESALEELMLLTYRDLFFISYGYLRDTMLAEDAVSETFLKLIEKIHTIKTQENLNGYIRTIVINKSLDILRRRKREFYPGDGFLDDMAREQNDGQFLRTALAAMEDGEREVLLLWHYKYRLHEISQKTNLTVNQVRGLLKKAKASFIAEYDRRVHCEKHCNLTGGKGYER